MKHIFLTGDIQVGKSTLINRILADIHPTLGGFRTRMNDVGPVDWGSIYLVAADGSEPCGDANRAFYRQVIDGRRRFTLCQDTFNIHGCELLTPQPEWQLILMDEIGTAESQCIAFRDAILASLDGDIPVLGVVQCREGGFLDDIRNHPNIELICVTEENRDALYPELRDLVAALI